MDDGLTDGHRRAVGSGMLIADSAAVHILDLLDDRNTSGTMKVIEGSVSDQEKVQIKSCLLRLRQRIVSLVNNYELEPSKRDLRQVLASHISQLWIALENSRPARIRGYGVMPAATAEALESDLQELLQIARQLRALLHS
ncbi:MAG TPA: hypothetical protein VF753_21335 [Terriglobales bacterium]